jgi:hypothetical protein
MIERSGDGAAEIPLTPVAFDDKLRHSLAQAIVVRWPQRVILTDRELVRLNMPVDLR